MKKVLIAVVTIIIVLGCVIYNLPYNKGRRLFDNGRYEEAIDVFLKSKKDCGEQIKECYLKIGDKLRSEGSYESALQAYEKADDEYGQFACKLDIANNYFEEGNYEAALIIYKEIDYPIAYAETCIRLGYKYIDNKDYDKAVEYFSLINYTDGLNECYVKIGNRYFSNKEYATALTYYENGQDINGINACHYEIGLQFYKDKNYEAALYELEKCNSYSNSKQLINKINEYLFADQYIGVWYNTDIFTYGFDIDELPEIAIALHKYEFVMKLDIRDDGTFSLYIEEDELQRFKETFFTISLKYLRGIGRVTEDDIKELWKLIDAKCDISNYQFNGKWKVTNYSFKLNSSLIFKDAVIVDGNLYLKSVKGDFKFTR